MTDEQVKVVRERRPRSPMVTVTATPEIIEKAIPANSGHCVWADAVKQAYPDAQRISVDLATIRFTDPKKGQRYTYLTPRSVQVSLVNFDQGIKPEPMSVRLKGGIVTKSSPKGGTGKAHSPIPPRRATLAPDYEGTTSGNVVDRVGGKTPPLAAYGNRGGQRREFGLRGLGRVPVKDTEAA